MSVEKMRKLAATQEDGKLPSYEWPGGYHIYYVDDDGNEFCPDCANSALADPDDSPFLMKPTAMGTHYEGAPIVCDVCNKEIPSAYGDPDAKE